MVRRYICKYCGEELENQGYLMNHAKDCPKNPKNQKQQYSYPTWPEKTQDEEVEEKPVEVRQRNKIAALIPEDGEELHGGVFVFLDPEEYEELLRFKELAHAQKERNERLMEEIMRLEKRPATSAEGKVFWPVSKLPEEIKLLMDGQFLSLKCTGRLHGDVVEIEDAKLL